MIYLAENVVDPKPGGNIDSFSALDLPAALGAGFIDLEAPRSDYERLLRITELVYQHTSLDGGHTFEGTRSALQTYHDRKGHCIERNMLLYSVVTQAGYVPELIIIKNPKSYEGAFLDFGEHLFLRIKTEEGLFLADAVCGKLLNNEPADMNSCYQPLTVQQFAAYYSNDMALDLYEHDKFGEALRWSEMALQLDPNNYMIHVCRGEIYGMMEEYRLADREFERSFEIAPRLMDVRAAYADFLMRHYGQEFAIPVLESLDGFESKDLDLCLNVLNTLWAFHGRVKTKNIVELSHSAGQGWEQHEQVPIITIGPA